MLAVPNDRLWPNADIKRGSSAPALDRFARSIGALPYRPSQRKREHLYRLFAIT